MSAAPSSLPWFAQHELRIQWRDLTAMLTGGSRRRAIVVTLVVLGIAIIGHTIANALVGPWVRSGILDSTTTYAQLTGTGLLFATMSLSQAMESITRAYYTRHDLDLILSSPASAPKLFMVRTGSVALTSMILTGFIISPFINVLAVLDGPRWLSAYLVIAAISLFTTALAVFITLALFQVAGPKRTRIIAQVLAALVGASLIVGIQVAVILSTGTTSGVGQVLSQLFLSEAPDPDNPLWLPARAAMGNLPALAIVLFGSIAILGLSLPASASSFARIAIAATGLSHARTTSRHQRDFAYRSQRQLLRRKEWKLLWRDPWLLSQSLMQLFYLLPPAILLWMNYGTKGATLAIVVAIITMASGQLSGGLAWLTISGEDAHDLVATAPLSKRQLYLAKIEAVVIAIGVITSPLLLGLLIINWQTALIAVIGIALACASSIAIQLMFRVRAKRSQFARRQTASRIATFIEAFVSINWAGAAGLAAVNPLIGAIATLPALLILLVVWLLRRNAKVI